MLEWTLIMMDECGDEIEFGRYKLPEGFDDPDLLDLWKDKKVDRMFREYPEASGYYWIDYTAINHRAMLAVRDFFDGDSYGEEGL